MSKAEVIDTLMQEWGAGEGFRDFFTRTVDWYMGDAKNATREDLDNLREIIHSMR